MKSWYVVFQSFFPSWKFFDDAGSEIRLSVRVGPSEIELGGWVNCLTPIPRTIKTIFINPQGAYLHAARNLVTRLSFEISDGDENRPEKIVEKTTYKIVKNLVRYQIADLKLASAPFYYQFRLSVSSMEHLSRDADHILMSSVYES